jgi:hypothetical protein
MPHGGVVDHSLAAAIRCIRPLVHSTASSTVRAHQPSAREFFPTFHEKAGALFAGIIQGHAPTDGNKRIAVVPTMPSTSATATPCRSRTSSSSTWPSTSLSTAPIWLGRTGRGLYRWTCPTSDRNHAAAGFRSTQGRRRACSDRCSPAHSWKGGYTGCCERCTARRRAPAIRWPCAWPCSHRFWTDLTSRRHPGGSADRSASLGGPP